MTTALPRGPVSFAHFTERAPMTAIANAPAPGDRVLMLELAARIRHADDLRLVLDALGLWPPTAGPAMSTMLESISPVVLPPIEPRAVPRRRTPPAETRERRGSVPKPRTNPTEKTCSRCGETKPAAEFYADPRITDGLRSECRACRPVQIIVCRCCGKRGPHGGKGWRAACYARWFRAGKPEGGPPAPTPPGECKTAVMAERLERYAQLRRRMTRQQAAQDLGISRETARRYEIRLKAREVAR